MSDKILSIEESNKIIAETKLVKLEYWLNIIKAIALVLGGIITYLFITGPDSVLSRKKSAEDISRARTQMLIEVLLKTKNPTELTLAYNTIKSTYQNTDTLWMIGMNKVVNERVNFLYELKNLNNKYNQLLRMKSELEEISDSRAIKEIDKQMVLLKEIISEFIRWFPIKVGLTFFWAFRL